MSTIKPHGRAALLTVNLSLTLSALFFALGYGTALAQPPQVGSSSPAAATAKDPAAMASLELPVAGGELATFFNEFDTAVRRPDGLAARRIGDLPEFRFAFDGKSMTVYVAGTGAWGTTSAPATLDAMLPAAGELGGLNMPFDELLAADPYSAITAGVTEARQVEQATVQGKKVEHLVLSSAELKVEYWIDPATELPVRSLVVYAYHPLRPHFAVEYAEWNLDAKLPDSTFALPKPPGATDVGFREAAGAFQ